MPEQTTNRRMRRPTPSMIVAVVALSVALGGTSYAALKLPAASVGTKQVRNKAITTGKLRDRAVTGVKVRDRSLLARDFKAGQLPAGPRGAAGAAGPQGPPGAPNPNASTLNGLPANGLIRVASNFSNLNQAKKGQGTVISTKITAPTAGRIVIQASSGLWSTADEFAYCTLQVDDVGVGGSGRNIQTRIGNVHPDVVCATGGVVAVGPGEHTIDLESQGADPDVSYSHPSLTAIFTPFGADGG